MRAPRGPRFLFHALSALALTLVLTAAGCAPREPAPPPTFEQMQLRMAREQCAQDATDMNPEVRRFGSNVLWRNYFEMCMRRLGVTDAALKTIRY